MMPGRPLWVWLALAVVLAGGVARARGTQQAASGDTPKTAPASAATPFASAASSSTEPVAAPVPHPLVLSVAPVEVASGVSFPYETAAVQAGLVKYLDEVFRKYHWTARYDVRAAQGQGASAVNAARQATDAASAPAYILHVEITKWNATKFPREVTVSDDVTGAATDEKIFTKTDAVLDDGSGDFPDLVARVLAGRIYPRFAEHAEDARTAPKTCLVQSCELEPHVSKASSIISWGLMASNPLSAAGIPIVLSRQKNDRKAESPKPAKGQSLAYGPDFDNDADESGYVMLRYQRRFIERSGYPGCYNAKERPTKAHMKLLRNVVALLKDQSYYRVPNFYWTVLYMTPQAGCINSDSVTNLKMVFVFTSLMDALHWNQDEIAGVIAHEAGHLQDRGCERRIGDAVSLRKPASMYQVCEAHADNIGLQYVLAAGLDPTRFAYSFAAFENIDPEGESERLRKRSDHPINRDRITNVVEDLDVLCKEGSERACHFLPLVKGPDSAKSGARQQGPGESH